MSTFSKWRPTISTLGPSTAKRLTCYSPLTSRSRETTTRSWPKPWVSTPLESLLQLPGSRVINYEPSLMLSLDEACRLQCRLSIETRTNAYQIRTGQFPEAPISVYFTVRQYWGRQPFKNFNESYTNQRK